MDYPVDIQSKIIIQRTYQTGFNKGLLNAVSLKLIQLIASLHIIIQGNILTDTPERV